MRTRRALLVAGLLGLVASATVPGFAGDDTTVFEEATYAGSSPGAWTCGPTGRANYGGLAGRVTETGRRPSRNRGAGLTVQAGAAAELEQVRIVDCRHGASSACGPDDWRAPPTRLLAGGGLRVGYRWRYFGLLVGGSAYQAWPDHDATQPAWRGLPDAELQFGNAVDFDILLGVGTPTVTGYRRPAVPYVGLGFEVAHQRVELRAGNTRTGPDVFEPAPRGDVVWFAPVGRRLRLRWSFGAGPNHARLGAETGLGVSTSL
jgi:hypothetical protein